MPLCFAGAIPESSVLSLHGFSCYHSTEPTINDGGLRTTFQWLRSLDLASTSMSITNVALLHSNNLTTLFLVKLPNFDPQSDLQVSQLRHLSIELPGDGETTKSSQILCNLLQNQPTRSKPSQSKSHLSLQTTSQSSLNFRPQSCLALHHYHLFQIWHR